MENLRARKQSTWGGVRAQLKIGIGALVGGRLKTYNSSLSKQNKQISAVDQVLSFHRACAMYKKEVDCCMLAP